MSNSRVKRAGEITRATPVRVVSNDLPANEPELDKFAAALRDAERNPPANWRYQLAEQDKHLRGLGWL